LKVLFGNFCSDGDENGSQKEVIEEKKCFGVLFLGSLSGVFTDLFNGIFC